MQSFIDCLLAVWVRCSEDMDDDDVDDDEEVDGFELDGSGVGASCEGDVGVSRGLVAELGGVVSVGDCVCASTSAVGAIEINPANKNVRRKLMKPLLINSTRRRLPPIQGIHHRHPSEVHVGAILRVRSKHRPNTAKLLCLRPG